MSRKNSVARRKKVHQHNLQREREQTAEREAKLNRKRQRKENAMEEEVNPSKQRKRESQISIKKVEEINNSMLNADATMYDFGVASKGGAASVAGKKVKKYKLKQLKKVESENTMEETKEFDLEKVIKETNEDKEKPHFQQATAAIRNTKKRGNSGQEMET